MRRCFDPSGDTAQREEDDGRFTTRDGHGLSANLSVLPGAMANNVAVESSAASFAPFVQVCR